MSAHAATLAFTVPDAEVDCNGFGCRPIIHAPETLKQPSVVPSDGAPPPAPAPPAFVGCRPQTTLLRYRPRTTRSRAHCDPPPPFPFPDVSAALCDHSLLGAYSFVRPRSIVRGPLKMDHALPPPAGAACFRRHPAGLHGAGASPDAVASVSVEVSRGAADFDASQRKEVIGASLYSRPNSSLGGPPTTWITCADMRQRVPRVPIHTGRPSVIFAFPGTRHLSRTPATSPQPTHSSRRAAAVSSTKLRPETPAVASQSQAHPTAISPTSRHFNRSALDPYAPRTPTG